MVSYPHVYAAFQLFGILINTALEYVSALKDEAWVNKLVQAEAKFQIILMTCAFSIRDCHVYVSGRKPVSLAAFHITWKGIPAQIPDWMQRSLWAWILAGRQGMREAGRWIC